MKAKIYLVIAAVGLGAAGVAALYRWQKRKTARPAAQEETAPDSFCMEWAAVLREDARVFNGLYNGLLRVQNGTAKKPEKVLREWCQRTHCRWEDQMVDNLCREHILPLIEVEDREALLPWANRLLDAAAAAGITRESAATLLLTENNAADYVDWDGYDLYPGDEVEILSAAWYQDGKLLEQGQCKKTQFQDKQ